MVSKTDFTQDEHEFVSAYMDKCGYTLDTEHGWVYYKGHSVHPMFNSYQEFASFILGLKGDGKLAD